MSEQLHELERAMIEAHAFRARQLACEWRKGFKPQSEWTPEEVARIVEWQNSPWLHRQFTPDDLFPRK